MIFTLALLMLFLASCSAWEEEVSPSYQCPYAQECEYTNQIITPVCIELQTVQREAIQISVSTTTITTQVPRSLATYETVEMSLSPVFLTSTTFIAHPVTTVTVHTTNVTSTLSSTKATIIRVTSVNWITTQVTKTVSRSAAAKLTVYQSVENSLTHNPVVELYRTEVVAKPKVVQVDKTQVLYTTYYSKVPHYQPVYTTVTSTYYYSTTQCVGV